MFIIISVEAIVFTKDLEDKVEKSLDGKVILECEISKEDLKVDWMKDGKRLKRDEHYDIQVEGKVHRLIIEKLAATDAGQYQAVYEKAETTGKLTIQGKGILKE